MVLEAEKHGREPKRRPEETHVAVLMGGWSAEREVSLASGKAVVEALRTMGYKVTSLDVHQEICRELAQIAPDVVFNALHGLWGEDGKVQGLLEMLGIPYTHSGVLASALAMDKHKSKILFRKARIPVADDRIVMLEDLMKGHPMSPPYVIKPVAEGSSVGVSIVIAEEEKIPVEKYADFKDVPLMVERYIPGRELTCAVMGDVALGVLEVIPLKAGYYDYESKYAEGGSRHECPARLPEEITRKIQRYALAAHKALGCRGASRVDFRFNDNGKGEGEIVILEVNTQPGLTPTSLLPEIAEQVGHTFSQLVAWMVDDASIRR